MVWGHISGSYVCSQHLRFSWQSTGRCLTGSWSWLRNWWHHRMAHKAGPSWIRRAPFVEWHGRNEMHLRVYQVISGHRIMEYAAAYGHLLISCHYCFHILLQYYYILLRISYRAITDLFVDSLLHSQFWCSCALQVWTKECQFVKSQISWVLGIKSSRHVYPVARLGIKKMTKEEADKVCISNKNRSHTKLRSTQGFIDVPLLLVGKVWSKRWVAAEDESG